MPSPVVVGFTVVADPPLVNPLGLVAGTAVGVPLDVSPNTIIDSKNLINLGITATINGCIAAGGYFLSAPVVAVLNAQPSNLLNDGKNVMLDDVTTPCPGGIMNHATLPSISCIGCIFRVGDPGQTSAST